MLLGDALVTGRGVSCWFLIDDGLAGYLHRCAVGCGSIGGCLGFLGGLFCCWVSGSRVGLVQGGLRRSSGVESVRHVSSDGVCDRLVGEVRYVKV